MGTSVEYADLLMVFIFTGIADTRSSQVPTNPQRISLIDRLSDLDLQPGNTLRPDIELLSFEYLSRLHDYH